MGYINAEVGRGDLAVIKHLIDKGDYETAGKSINVYLADAPDDVDGLYLLGLAMYEAGQAAPARLVFQHLTEREPEKSYHWFQLGRCWEWLTKPKKAEECFKKALERGKDIHTLAALSTNYVMQGNSREAIRYAHQVLDLDPKYGKAHSNLGFAYLLDRQYGKGWEEYEAALGHLLWRDERIYPDTKRWNGTPDKENRMVVYTEQGLGDEIAGVEVLKDVIEQNNVYALDCSPKLKNLFARSFPQIKVFGTHTKKDLAEWGPTPDLKWSTSVFSCHKHLRKSEDDYKKKPYLIADPERRIMWRALLDSLGPQLKVGLAWSGGISLTQRGARRAALDQLLPILNQDAIFIDLEYKDRTKDIEAFERRRKVKIHSWSWATRTQDYDDTAALVAELDLVISVPTAITHLAGALGVPCWCLTHPRPHYHYAMHGEKMPYYDSVRMYRRESDDDWLPSVKMVANDLKAMINGVKQLQHDKNGDRRLAGSI